MIAYQKSIPIIKGKDVVTKKRGSFSGQIRCEINGSCSSIPGKLSVFYVQHTSIILSSNSYSWQVNYFSFYQCRIFFNAMHDFRLFFFFFSQFRCCGVTNHTDWFEVYNASRVPDSCCLEYSDNCGLDNPGTWWTAVSSEISV